MRLLGKSYDADLRHGVLDVSPGAGDTFDLTMWLNDQKLALPRLTRSSS
jgi:hypothetical protein